MHSLSCNTLKILILCFCFLVITKVQSQSFTPYVIGAAGAFSESPNGSISWTIGEVITDSHSSSANSLTQGFHQPDSSFSVLIINNLHKSISVYPNPVVDNVVIDFSASRGNYFLEIVDIKGQLLRKEYISESRWLSGQKQLTVSFLEFANGIYLLNIIDKESNTLNSYKINKSE